MRGRSVPVVMYHHVSPVGKDVNVVPELFEDQLKTLYKKGWKSLSGEEFLTFLENKEIPQKCVLLTFDDGFADNYVYAYPLLKKYNMKAMLFVAASFIDDVDIKRDRFNPLSHEMAWDLVYTDRRSEVMCTWKELKEMEQSGIFDIQSHGMSHRTPDFIRHKNYTQLRDDLSGGKIMLENKLLKEILHFAWPKGRFDKEGIRIANEVGYKALYTTDRGANTSANSNMIKRLPVRCKRGRWLAGKLPIYSSVFLSRIYLRLRTG